ncbi:MAG TPA: GNAT family N-acetyltransferase [Pseudonocardia sp.]|nr:GNAT family N-acetyltransferase [Pseudonocardia sp.]
MSRVLDRIDRFCDAVPRRWAEAVDDGPLRLFVRSGPGWPFYARPVPGGGPVRAEDVVRMRTRQRALRVPESVEWVPAAAPTVLDAVRATGLRVSLCPLLVLDGDPLPVPFPPGCVGRLLGPADGDLVAAAHALHSVVAQAFGYPPPGALSASEATALRADLAAGRLARLLVVGPDGPVAGGSAQRAGDVVELVGIGTLAAHRGRGLAAAVTATLAAAARAAGAEVVFLAAGDEAAARVYRRVGFRVIGETGIAEVGRA